MKIRRLACFLLAAGLLTGCAGAASTTPVAGTAPTSMPRAIDDVITADDASYLLVEADQVSFLRWMEVDGSIDGSMHMTRADANHATGTETRTESVYGIRDGDSVRLSIGQHALTGVLSGDILSIVNLQDDGQLGNVVYERASVDDYNRAVAELGDQGKGAAVEQDAAAEQAARDAEVDVAMAAYTSALGLVEQRTASLDEIDLSFAGQLADVDEALDDVRAAYRLIESKADSSNPDCYEVGSLAYDVGSAAYDVGSEQYDVDSDTGTALRRANALDAALTAARAAHAQLNEAVFWNPAPKVREPEYSAWLRDLSEPAVILLDAARDRAKAAAAKAAKRVTQAEAIQADADALAEDCDDS